MKHLKSRRGQGMTEYIIIVAIIAIAAIAAFKLFGSKIREGIGKSAQKIETEIQQGIDEQGDGTSD
jgi:Flp pilus assembly pilin Flp